MQFYINNLKNTKLILPTEITHKKHVYHLFTIHHPKANEIIKKMLLKNIELRKNLSSFYSFNESI